MSVLRPTSFAAAAALLAQHGPAARPIAGGTDTLTRLDAGATPPEVWVDLSSVQQGRDITLRGDSLHIGALVSFEAMAGSAVLAQALPALHHAANIMGSLQVRTRGTLGGNLCNASPAGDAIPPLVVAGAELQLVSVAGERWLPLTAFLLGPGQTALQLGEVVAGVRCPVVPGSVSAFVRVGARAHHVITKASAAVACRLDQGVLRDVRFALGAVAPTVIRAPQVEGILEGQRLTLAVLAQAGEASAAAARPIDDLRSTAAYRREACRQLVGIVMERAGLLPS
jgi:CO/xanthine dehydrogenase FAD-binding subunit